MRPSISIAMATYNGSRYLKEQLDSFASQSCLPDELVVCDDASRDDTYSILRQFADVAPFKVRLKVNPVTIGFAQNFGRAINLCSGGLVFLSDQDDIWLPDKLQLICSAFSTAESPYVVINDAELMSADGEPLGLTKEDQVRSIRQTEVRTMGCCTALRRDFMAVVLPIPEQICHDVWIHALAQVLGKRKSIPDVLQRYRRHDANVSNAISSRLKPAGWWHRYANAWRNSNVGKKLKLDIEIFDALLSRITDRRHLLLDELAFSEKDVLDVEKRLRANRELALKRMNARQVAGPRRLMEVARVWYIGGYNYREGWARMFMDCIRR